MTLTELKSLVGHRVYLPDERRFGLVTGYVTNHAESVLSISGNWYRPEKIATNIIELCRPDPIATNIIELRRPDPIA